MKRIIPIVISFLIFGKVISQSPMPTYSDNPQWNMVYSGFFSSYCYSVNIFLKPDTFICGRSYSPILWCSPHNCSVSAYFRQSGDKVYIRYQWSTCSQEYLVYDFDLNVGDTAFCMSDLGDSTKFWVVNKANVTYEGISRLTFNVNYYYYGNAVKQVKWIYGVGSNYHPFLSLACIGPECEGEQQLVEAAVNGTVTYKDTALTFLCPYWDDIKENSSTSEIKIYPSVTHSEINIEADREGEYRINNILGQQVISGLVQRGDNKMDISSLNAGLYFFIFKSGNSSYSARFIKE